MLLAKMECATLSSHLTSQSFWTFSEYGFNSVGRDRCAISLFASKPGRNKTRSSWAANVEIADAISKPDLGVMCRLGNLKHRIVQMAGRLRRL
jgi:hypothetical protein